jgi:hypothetical protein
MRQILLWVTVIGSAIVAGSCASDSQAGPDSDRFVLVEGAWHGTLEQADLVVTFIEGEFEGAPTVSGSAYLSSSASGDAFLIYGGIHNRLDSVWFSLYPISISGKASFVLRGGVRPDQIQGSFQQYDSSGHRIGSGSWQVRRAWEG